jgi:hypothetical protein
VSDTLPPGFITIEERPPEEADEVRADRRRLRHDIADATVFHNHVQTGRPEELAGRLYAWSGSPDSRSYRGATQFRPLSDMDWMQACIAVNRLISEIPGEDFYNDGRRPSVPELVALAEFALTAQNFDFVGKKGEAAPKFRKELAHAITVHLSMALVTRPGNWSKAARIVEKPIADCMPGEWPYDNNELRANVPMPDGTFVQVINARPEQAFASLEYLRTRLAECKKQRPLVDNVSDRLCKGDVTAQEYAAAICTAADLEFLSGKLVAFYGGIMHSMPIYRLYPAISECQAFDLWWPWGRVMPLVDGGSAKAPTPRRRFSIRASSRRPARKTWYRR